MLNNSDLSPREREAIEACEQVDEETVAMRITAMRHYQNPSAGNLDRLVNAAHAFAKRVDTILNHPRT